MNTAPLTHNTITGSLNIFLINPFAISVSKVIAEANHLVARTFRNAFRDCIKNRAYVSFPSSSCICSIYTIPPVLRDIYTVYTLNKIELMQGRTGCDEYSAKVS